MLDLVFSNNPHMIPECAVSVNPCFSDHSSIVISLNKLKDNTDNTKNKKSNLAKTNLPEYDFLNASDEDWVRMNTAIARIDWEHEFEDKSPD